MITFDRKDRINFEHAKLLLIDDHPEGASILIEIIRAFGVKQFRRCAFIAESKHFASENEIDLIIINANLKYEHAFKFMNWLRRADLGGNSFAPVILISGHTQKSNVERARDCGANAVLTKPVSPASVLERILWVAREKRPYVKCATYVGPDRRFHDDGPPLGVPGRRYDDAPEALEASFDAPEEPGASYANQGVGL